MTHFSFCVVRSTKGQVIEDFQDRNDYLGTHLKIGSRNLTPEKLKQTSRFILHTEFDKDVL